MQPDTRAGRSLNDYYATKVCLAKEKLTDRIPSQQLESHGALQLETGPTPGRQMSGLTFTPADFTWMILGCGKTAREPAHVQRENADTHLPSLNGRILAPRAAGETPYWGVTLSISEFGGVQKCFSQVVYTLVTFPWNVKSQNPRKGGAKFKRLELETVPVFAGWLLSKTSHFAVSHPLAASLSILSAAADIK